MAFPWKRNYHVPKLTFELVSSECVVYFTILKDGVEGDTITLKRKGREGRKKERNEKQGIKYEDSKLLHIL